MHIQQVSIGDDLLDICRQMQPDNWAADNEMTSFQPERLRKFLDAGGLLFLAWENDRIAGSALCYEMLHPAGEDTLYVHELDTHPDFRRQGVGTTLMEYLFEVARKRDLSEVWLGADNDNPAANALYNKLNPSEVDPTITYSYKVQ